MATRGFVFLQRGCQRERAMRRMLAEAGGGGRYEVTQRPRYTTVTASPPSGSGSACTLGGASAATFRGIEIVAFVFVIIPHPVYRLPGREH